MAEKKEGASIGFVVTKGGGKLAVPGSKKFASSADKASEFGPRFIDADAHRIFAESLFALREEDAA